MAEIHGSEARVYANGIDISSLFQEVEGGRERDLLPTDGFGTTNNDFIVSPISSAAMSASGMLDVHPVTGVRLVKDMLDAANENLAGDDIVVMMLRDTTLGDPGFALVGSTQQQRLKQPLKDVIKTSLEAKANRGIWVLAVHPLAARVSATTSVGITNTVLSSNGGIGVLTATAISGSSPVLTHKIQHSSDSTNGIDGAWVDLITFPTVTTASVAAGYAEYVAVTGTVNKYVRHVFALTSGSLTSVTYAAQFGRYNANN